MAELNSLQLLENEYAAYLRGLEIAGDEPLRDWLKAKLKTASSGQRVLLRSMAALRNKVRVYDELTGWAD